MRKQIKPILFFSLLFFLPVFFFGNDIRVEKILYKKVLIDYQQVSLVNVILNSYSSGLSKVAVFFNGSEIKKINPLYSNINGIPVLTSFSFEVGQIKPNNYLEIFFEDSMGVVSSSEMMMKFERGFVLHEDDFVTKFNKIFFIKIENQEHRKNYKLEIENEEIVKFLEQTEYMNATYLKFQTKEIGSTTLKLHHPNQSVIYRIVNIMVTD